MAGFAGGPPRWLMIVLVVAAVGGACTPRTPPAERSPRPPAETEPVRYRVDFGRRGNGALSVAGGGAQVCLTLRMPLPKAAHLHERGPFGDTVLATFFEPPAPSRRRTCVREAEAQTDDLLRQGAPRLYVDVHYGPRDEGVVGELVRRDA